VTATPGGETQARRESERKTMEGEPILKKTLYTVAVMLAAWTAFIGVVSMVAVLVTTHAVAAPGTVADDAPGQG